MISSLVCISDQKYRHGARQNFYSEWRPQQRVENRTVHLGAALRNDVYWPLKREERDRGEVERLRVFFFFFLF